MPERADLVAEAQQLISQYRKIASRTPIPDDLHSVGLALGRALEALESQGARGALWRAEEKIAAARETLARVRRSLGT